jgi:uncharacterized protein YaaR (DUF327 family)
MEQLTNKERKWYKLLAIDKEYIEIVHEVKYHHYYRQQIDVSVYIRDSAEKYPHIMKLYDKISSFAENIIEKEVDELRGKLKKQGYEQIEYFNSDEYADDCLIHNDYEFQESGEQF